MQLFKNLIQPNCSDGPSQLDLTENENTQASQVKRKNKIILNEIIGTTAKGKKCSR
jgi:hypothetical protein